MSNNFEGGYEDSYQKGDRLKGELQSAVDDLRNYLSVYEKDSGMAKDSLEKIKDNLAKFDALKEQEEILEEKIDQKQKELAELNKSEPDIDKKIEAGELIYKEIRLLREKIMEIDGVIDRLMSETNVMDNEQPGIMGDLQGTTGVIKMKYDKINELRKQIKELEGNSDF